MDVKEDDGGAAGLKGSLCVPTSVSVDWDGSLFPEGWRFLLRPLDLNEVNDLLNMVSDVSRLGLLVFALGFSKVDGLLVVSSVFVFAVVDLETSGWRDGELRICACVSHFARTAW
jgi:hypothetical protein